MKVHFRFDGTSWTAGLVVSIAIAGAFIGALIAGGFASKYGRIPALGLADVLFTIGSLTLAFSGNIYWVFFGRAVVGLGIGIASVVVPVYLSEMTAAQTRGRVVSFNNGFVTGSQFIAAAFCGVMIHVSGDDVGWRVMFGAGAVPAVLQFLGVVFFSPRVLGGFNAALEEKKHITLHSSMALILRRKTSSLSVHTSTSKLWSQLRCSDV